MLESLGQGLWEGLSVAIEAFLAAATLTVGRVAFMAALGPSPRNVRTQILRLLGPKTILYKALGLF